MAKGTYTYYFCVGRRDKSCNLPYLAAPDLEQYVIDHYTTVAFPEQFRVAVQATFDDELEANIVTSAHLRETINKRLGGTIHAGRSLP